MLHDPKSYGLTDWELFDSFKVGLAGAISSYIFKSLKGDSFDYMLDINLVTTAVAGQQPLINGIINDDTGANYQNLGTGTDTGGAPQRIGAVGGTGVILAVGTGTTNAICKHVGRWLFPARLSSVDAGAIYKMMIGDMMSMNAAGDIRRYNGGCYYSSGAEMTKLTIDPLSTITMHGKAVLYRRRI